jgi:excisionase family DNA binding protein
VTAPAPLPPPFSVPQLAQRWGCSEGLIRKLIRNKRLQCFRPGSLIRISVAEVERFECQQQMTTHGASNDSGEGSPSSGGKPPAEPEPAAEGNSPRKIGRAPKRKRAASGAMGTILPGPWAGL